MNLPWCSRTFLGVVTGVRAIRAAEPEFDTMEQNVPHPAAAYTSPLCSVPTH